MEGFSLSAAVARFGVVELSKWHWLPGRRGEPSSHGFYKSMPYVLPAIISMSSTGLTKVQKQTSVQNSYMDTAIVF